MNERYVREARRVPMKAGSMILWNSMMLHQGWNRGPRLAVPICWEPRSRRNSQTYRRKVRLCASGLPTTHWASLGRQHNITLSEAHAPTTLEFNFFCTNDKDYNGDDIILKSSIISEQNEIGTNDIRLPRCSILPKSLKQDMNLDFYRDVMPLCHQLEESCDSSEDIVRTLETLIKPEILALI